jgi:pantoate--beta-alanine ligase
MAMKVITEVEGVRRGRWEDRSASWGLVPTMGFLHEGHLDLIRRARSENDRVGVSIFVNPIQFSNPGDLEKYPRDMDRDSALLEKEGVDLLWTPTPEIVYPRGYQTYVNVNQVSTHLEGAARPGHFQGVATVVAKLFNVFQPTRAYFGQKDAQQLLVIRRMVKDLDLNLQIVACPTVRENDGLAMSSRNVRLTPEHRCQAVCLYKALSVAGSAFRSGNREADHLREMMIDVISEAPAARIDYVSVADPETLDELLTIEAGALLSLAVFFGDVRLIDNLVLSPRM